MLGLAEPWYSDQFIYQRFNPENVSAVDLKKTPISAVTPDCIQTAVGSIHAVDLIVLVAGLDAINSSFYAAGFKSLGGKSPEGMQD